MICFGGSIHTNSLKQVPTKQVSIVECKCFLTKFPKATIRGSSVCYCCQELGIITVTHSKLNT